MNSYEQAAEAWRWFVHGYSAGSLDAVEIDPSGGGMVGAFERALRRAWSEPGQAGDNRGKKRGINAASPTTGDVGIAPIGKGASHSPVLGTTREASEGGSANRVAEASRKARFREAIVRVLRDNGALGTNGMRRELSRVGGVSVGGDHRSPFLAARAELEAEGVIVASRRPGRGGGKLWRLAEPDPEAVPS